MFASNKTSKLEVILHAWNFFIAFGIKSWPQIILKIKEVANKLKSFLFYVWGLQAEKVIRSVANHNTLCYNHGIHLFEAKKYLQCKDWQALSSTILAILGKLKRVLEGLRAYHP
jgi:uracil DNA glycosylase